MKTTAILNALPVPAVIITKNLRVFDLNTSSIQLFGDGLKGRHLATILRLPAVLNMVESVLETGQAGSVRHLLNINGHKHLFDIHVSRIECEDAALLSFLDGSEKEETEQMRSDFVANVSHELRSPLTALSGIIETLRGPAQDDAQARARFLEIMQNEAGRMDRLVTDLLALIRVENMAKQRPTDEIRLDQLILSLISTLSPTAQNREITLEIAPDCHRAIIVRGDRDQLIQVFTNLIENAIKYGHEGTPIIVRIEQKTGASPSKTAAYVVEVKDQGAGIASHHLARLSERFYRVDNHRSREIGGTGLGLSIVKHIVQRHGGRLNIKSTLGLGCSFFVTLPTFDDGNA